MDFFTAVKDSVQRVAPTDHDDVDSFAHAIASRHDPSNILMTRLNPTPSLNFTSMANMSLSTPSCFLSITPNDLDIVLNDPSTLIIDIRPHAAYSSARLPRALSLSVPSTLLKRPLFSLARLSAMLPSESARSRFSAWNSASRIIVYDADANAIPDSSNIQGLLRKFKNDNFKGDLAWLQGGFQAVWRERRALIDTTPEAELDDDDDRPSLSTSASSPAVPVLRPRNLPMSAFSLSSTTAHSPSKAKQRPNSMSIPLPAPQPHVRNAYNPFFDAVRQNVELLQGITERIPLQLPRRVHRRIPDLPFPWLQEIAKKAQHAPRIHHHQPHSLNHRPAFSDAPPFSTSPSSSSSEDTSDSDTNPDPADVEEGTEALAMQFYRIEVAEQRRLMGVMERHSRESGFLTNGGESQRINAMTFPYSITAGVEKGTKNRYRHIWPFEHARVRLHGRSGDQKRDHAADDVDDYVNASYVQPLGTQKRYIATQGPLEATFNDFWRLCWEQNVHVIVMLTREVEGLTVKCGSYWVEDEGRERIFGPLTLRLISKISLPEQRRGTQTQIPPPGDGFFGSAIPHTSACLVDSDPLSARRRRQKSVTTIKRTFELSHSRYPHLGSRKVVQLQYLEWPDMNVPDDARGVLGLIKEVEKAVDETWDGRGAALGNSPVVTQQEKIPLRNLDEQSGIAKHALGGKERRPVLLHCSAGVGRTGGFIAVDAVLDAVRREMRKRKRSGRETEDSMDVDEDASQGVDVNGADMMTVPIPVSAGTEGQNANVAGASSGLVMHVPAVVVPETTGVVPRTPMQVDGSHVGVSGPSASTREWAQDVLDQTGGGSSASPFTPSGAVVPSSVLAPHRLPQSPFKTGSSSSSSTLPTDSDDSGILGIRRIAKESSSLGTSVSGLSEEEKLVGMNRTESPLGMGSGVFSEGENVEPNSSPQRRPRTLSAPHTHLKSRSHLGGMESSPLASSSTSWTGGRRDKKQMARFVKAGLIGPSSDDGPPPSQTMGSTADEDEAASSVAPLGHARSTLDQRHVLSKSSPPLAHPSSSPEQTPDRLAGDPHSTTVDYKEPRRLHDLNSPILLSSFEEPVWQVVQDMREQRMSLCQSLRQYVFVHAAIIEGALMIVDEEREQNEEGTNVGGGGVEMSTTPATKSPNVGSSSSPLSNRDRPTACVKFAPSPVPPVVRPSLTMLTNPSEASMTSMSSTGKRGASPTELLKEGKQGEVLLSKRPSIKRKQTRQGSGSDQRGAAFYKSTQVQNYYQSGQGAGSLSASSTGLHLQLEMVPPSPSPSSSSP